VWAINVVFLSALSLAKPREASIINVSRKK
jgi:hypothetical protein